MKQYLYITFLLCLICENLYSQTPVKFETFSINNEPYNALATTCFQDSKGFLWIGGYNGLKRYDGYQLIEYASNPNDTMSLSDSKIEFITEDLNSNLWIATQNGLNCYNRKSDSFKRIMYDEDGDLIGGTYKVVHKNGRI